MISDESNIVNQIFPIDVTPQESDGHRLLSACLVNIQVMTCCPTAPILWNTLIMVLWYLYQFTGQDSTLWNLFENLTYRTFPGGQCVNTVVDAGCQVDVSTRLTWEMNNNNTHTYRYTGTHKKNRSGGGNWDFVRFCFREKIYFCKKNMVYALNHAYVYPEKPLLRCGVTCQMWISPVNTLLSGWPHHPCQRHLVSRN